MADYKLSYTGEQVDDALGKAIKAVSTDPQTLSAEQKAQAIQNIGAAKIDDESVTSKTAWSSQHIVDTLCPEFSVSGNPAVCYPVAGSKLGVAVSWEPTQEGSGEPSPSNIRPIVGKSSVSVSRQEDEFSMTLTTPESICAGEVNLENSGWEKWKKMALPKTGWFREENPNFVRFNNRSALPFDAKVDVNADQFDSILCDSLQARDTSKNQNAIQLEFFTKTMLRISLENITTEEEFTDWINSHQIEIAYRLDAPQFFQATGGAPISAVSGANTFSTNADSLTITGRADPTHTINALANRVAALETAAANG